MTNVAVLPGGRVNKADALVATDQETIVGNGTAADPLRAGPLAAGGTFDAELLVNGIGPGPFTNPKGFALMMTDAATTVEALDPESGGRCVGLLTVDAETGETVRVQNTGLFTMTADEWNAVIQGGAPMGLTPSAAYFASASTNGKLKLSLFSPGDIVIQIGVAINTTQLLLQIAPPVEFA